MLAGMFVGMDAAMMPVAADAAATAGAVWGLVGIVIIWIVNNGKSQWYYVYQIIIIFDIIPGRYLIW